MQRLDIAVCGCGPAGLASALLLYRLGHRVVIFERFAEPKPIGSGLILQPTGLAVLDELELLGKIFELGAPIDRLLGRVASTGRIALDVRYEALGAGWQALGIHRAALFDVLYRAVRETSIEICGDVAIASVRYRGQKIELIAADGKALGSFDLVVDALGANSSLADHSERRKALDYGAVWVNVAWPHGDRFDKTRLEQRYVRAEKMVGVLPIGRRQSGDIEQAAFFWSLKRSSLATLREGGLARWFDEISAVWPDALKLVADIADIEQLTFAQYDHFTARMPIATRLAHIGDAAHATSPQLGQGANMALLDALALVRAIERHSTLDSALLDYAHMRRWHVRLFQYASALFTPFYQSDSRALPILRDWITVPMSRMPVGRSIVARLVSGMTLSPLRGAHFAPYRRLGI